MAITQLERSVEISTGETVETIRSTPLAELRKRLELRFKKSMRFAPKSDTLRGTILRRNRGEILSREQVEASLDKALRK